MYLNLDLSVESNLIRCVSATANDEWVDSTTSPKLNDTIRFEHSLSVANSYKVSLGPVLFYDNDGNLFNKTNYVTKEQNEPNLDFQRFILKMQETGKIQVSSILMI